MSPFFPSFFLGNTYFIDEKVQFFKFHNHYKVYDKDGMQIGSVVQQVSGKHKFLRLFLSKAMLPFMLEIIDNNEKVVLSIHRGWTFWMSKISIVKDGGTTIGYIRQKFKIIRPSFRIFDQNENEIGMITGDWKAWSFSIKDTHGNEIGTINKKWAGITKEFVGSASAKVMAETSPQHPPLFLPSKMY